MTDYVKAMHILAYMAKVHRPACFLSVDDVLCKASPAELDFFYRWCQPL